MGQQLGLDEITNRFFGEILWIFQNILECFEFNDDKELNTYDTNV